MYQPKLRDDLIPRLYQLGKTLDVPMTKLASVLMEFGIKMLEQTLTRNGYQPPNGDASAQRQPAEENTSCNVMV